MSSTRLATRLRKATKRIDAMDGQQIKALLASRGVDSTQTARYALILDIALADRVKPEPEVDSGFWILHGGDLWRVI